MKASYDPEAGALYINVNDAIDSDKLRAWTTEGYAGNPSINADWQESPDWRGEPLLLGLEVFLPEPLQILTSDATGSAYSLPMVIASSHSRPSEEDA